MSTTKPPPPPPSRRKHPRYDLMAQVQIPLVGEVLLLTVVNISAGGVLLKVDRSDLPDIALDVVVEVFLDVPVPGADELISLKGNADVVRITPGDESQFPTVALMWSSSDAEFARTLARVLEMAKSSLTT